MSSARADSRSATACARASWVSISSAASARSSAALCSAASRTARTRSAAAAADDLRSRAHGLTRNAPRMNGWIRQKYVYVPGARFDGVCHWRLPVAGGTSLPSVPDSNWTFPSAIGYAIPVVWLQGALHEVIEW